MAGSEAPVQGESRREQLPPTAYRHRASRRLYATRPTWSPPDAPTPVMLSDRSRLTAPEAPRNPWPPNPRQVPASSGEALNGPSTAHAASRCGGSAVAGRWSNATSVSRSRFCPGPGASGLGRAMVDVVRDAVIGGAGTPSHCSAAASRRRGGRRRGGGPPATRAGADGPSTPRSSPRREHQLKSRNGGYRSVASSVMYACTRKPRRSSPTSKSKILACIAAREEDSELGDYEKHQGHQGDRYQRDVVRQRERPLDQGKPAVEIMSLLRLRVAPPRNQSDRGARPFAPHGGSHVKCSGL